MKNKLFIQIVFLVFLSMSIVSASESFVFKQGENSTLEIAMANADLSNCLTCTCQISLFYPNGSAMVLNDVGNNVNGFCDYSFIAEINGIYGGELYFTDGTDYGRSTFEFLINPLGNAELGVPEGILYVIFIIIALLFFLFTLYLSIRIPYSNARNIKGDIVGIEKKKYYKLSMILISYGLFVWLLNLLIGISVNFLSLNIFYGFVNMLFMFFIRMSYIFFTVIIVLFGWNFFKDINISKQIKSFGSAVSG